MNRFGRWIVGLGAAAACVTGTAAAQSASDPGAITAAFTLGPTFGNKSSMSFGGEVDYKLATEWEAFAEFGRMLNVASEMTDERAALIATSIGASPSVASRATYFDVGMKYLLVPFGGGYQPYAALGFGFAHVSQDVVFSVNDSELSEEQLAEQYGVQLGSDLAGSTIKPLFLIGAGITRSFYSRYYLDLSYRYGRIFAKTGTIEDDKGMNTNRLQLGIGVRF
jgi:opacity protein-like surface antigen